MKRDDDDDACWGRRTCANLCLENVLAVGKVNLTLVLTLGDARALVL